MRQPLRLQILLPAAGLLIAAVCINAVFAALWASQRSARQLTAQLEQVGQVLAETSFPRSPVVLEKLRQLTGADFAIWDERSGQLTTTTLAEPLAAELREQLSQLLPAETVSRAPLTLHSQRFRVSRIEAANRIGPEVLFVLLAEEALSADRWAAVVPALVVGLGSLLLLVPLMLHVARRIGQRIGSVQNKVIAVAAGNYDPIADDSALDDEVQGLLLAVNELSARLRHLQSQIETTERARVLGQFAGGMAHQLRNAITGARLAVQLHERRCPADKSDESLRMALKQLSLTEHQLRGLLSLGRQEAPALTECDPAALAAEVLELVSVTAQHVGVNLGGEMPTEVPALLLDRTAVQAAILNLVLNGVEACGRGGQVRLVVSAAADTVTWTVRDTGAGPSPAAAARMFEPFQTTKPEGGGLGLALARQVAGDHHGELQWERRGDWTEFRLMLPRRVAAKETAENHEPDLGRR